MNSNQSHLDHIKDLLFFADNIPINNRKHTVTVISITEVIKAIKYNFFNKIVWPYFSKIPTSGNSIIKHENINTEKMIRNFKTQL